MASTHSRINGQPYPGYILQFATDAYLFNLVIQPAAPIDGVGSGELGDDQLSVLEGLLQGMAGWLATQPNVVDATGSPDLVRIDETTSTLYAHP